MLKRRANMLRLLLAFAVIVGAAAGLTRYLQYGTARTLAAADDLANRRVPGHALAAAAERFALRALDNLDGGTGGPNDWQWNRARDALRSVEALAGQAGPAGDTLRREAEAASEALARLAAAHEEARATRNEADAAREILAAAAEHLAAHATTLDPAHTAGSAGEDPGLDDIIAKCRRWAALCAATSRAAGLAAKVPASPPHSTETQTQLERARRTLDELAKDHAPPEALETPDHPVTQARAALQATETALANWTESNRRAAQQHTGAQTAREDAARQLQAMVQTALLGLERDAKQVYTGLAAAEQTLSLGLVFLLLLGAGVSLVTVFSVGQVADEASLPVLCQCGKLNAPAARFCSRCGHDLSS